MTDINVPPPIVPQEWDKVDTTIDDESPLVLSSEQFTRYCVTIRDLLCAAGLRVQDFDRETPSFLIIDDEDLSMQITLDADRMASVEITLSEDLMDVPNTVRAASRIARLFELGRTFDRVRARLD